MVMQEFKDLCKYPFDKLATATSPCALDTETIGNTPALNIPFYFSWSSAELGTGAGPLLTAEGCRFCTELCKAQQIPKIFHNAKFDVGVLRRAGFEVKGKIHDTILMHCLLDEHDLDHHKLKPLSEHLLGHDRSDEAAAKAYGFKQENRLNTEVPQDVLHLYSLRDARDTWELAQLLMRRLLDWSQEDSRILKLYQNEVACSMVYMDMHERGIGYDQKASQEALEAVKRVMDDLAEKLFTFWGVRINLQSPQQLSRTISKYLTLTVRTEKGEKEPGDHLYSTDKEILQQFIEIEWVQWLAAWKYLNSARKNFAGYEKRQVNGRLHSDYNQTTTTGRSSSSDPNLQNIPKNQGRLTELELGDEELATICAEAFRKVRKVFIASPGSLLVAMDEQQAEYRAFAYYTASERLLAALARGEDFHKYTCLLVFEDYEERLRHVIKIVNYGLIYGMGNELLEWRINLAGGGIGSGKEILARYERMLPEMRETQMRIKRQAAQFGYVTDVFGRRYRYQHERPHAIVSWLCQGSVANMKKYSLTRVDKLFKTEAVAGSGAALDIHDEIVAEVYPADANLLFGCKKIMETFPEFAPVPFTVDVAVGHNLLEMKKMSVEEAVETVCKAS